MSFISEEKPGRAGPLLQALADAAGLPALSLDADGGCALAFDGLTVHFQYDAASQALTCFAELGVVPLERRAAVTADMLRANRFWRGTGGATLSLDDAEPPMAVLAQRFDDRTPGAAPDFVASMTRFVDHVQQWKASISGDATDATSAPAAGTPVFQPPPMFGQMA